MIHSRQQPEWDKDRESLVIGRNGLLVTELLTGKYTKDKKQNNKNNNNNNTTTQDPPI